MTHLVAISPHLDDAAFSLGGYLASRACAGDRVTIVTCFTGNVARPRGFALACQLDKGLPADIDYMALRRQEDLAACAVIGATAIHLPFLEAPHRGYATAPALFAERRADDTVLAPLFDALKALIEALAPDMIAGPLAIGGHVDHGITRDALAAMPQPVLLWEDWPYVRRAGFSPRQKPDLRHRLSISDHAMRVRMCASYESQIGFQFGGTQQLEQQSLEITEERLYAS